MGASVTLREARDGALLLELPKRSKPSSAANSIATALSGKLGDSVGKVSQLGVQVEIKVLDLDAVSSAADVLEALRAAIPGQDDPEIAAEREGICDVRIWPVRGGQQMVTEKISRYAASKIKKVPVGWTMCRVRPRKGALGARPSATTLGAAPLQIGPMAGLSMTSHKPGWGACAARRYAAGLRQRDANSLRVNQSATE
ncbi:hypothetical protein QTP88_018229 [Uroleucon formosanum]